MRSCSLRGTAPPNTSVSVPRLIPEKSVRTRTSPDADLLMLNYGI